MSSEAQSSSQPPPRRVSSEQKRPPFTLLRSDRPSWQPFPTTLSEVRRQEGERNREARLRALWSRLPNHYNEIEPDEKLWSTQTSLNDERARRLWAMYQNELRKSCSTKDVSTRVAWQAFVEYTDQKEEGLFLSNVYFISLM